MGTLTFSDIPDLKKMSVIEDKDGNQYLGETNAAGEEEGYGIKSNRDGSLYVGMWKEGKAHGNGWFFHASDDQGGDVYKGQWADDKANGSGIYRHANG